MIHRLLIGSTRRTPISNYLPCFLMLSTINSTLGCSPSKENYKGSTINSHDMVPYFLERDHIILCFSLILIITAYKSFKKESVHSIHNLVLHEEKMDSIDCCPVETSI